MRKFFLENDQKCYAKRKIGIVIGLMIMLIIVLAPNPVEAKGLSKKQQHQLYEKTLQKQRKKFRKIYNKSNGVNASNYDLFYCFADIDSDGVDELIMRYIYINDDWLKDTSHSDCRGDENTIIFTIQKNKVKKIKSNERGCPYITSSAADDGIMVYKNYIVTYMVFGGVTYDFERYSKGKLKEHIVLNPKGSGIWYYQINEVIVTKKEYNNKFNKLTNNKTGYQLKRM